MRSIPANPLTRMSVNYQLILLFLLMVSPVFILQWYGNMKAEQILKRNVTNAYLELNKQNWNLLNRDMESINRITMTIIQNPLTQQMLPDDTDTVVTRVGKYEALDKLLKSYSIGGDDGGAVAFSLYVNDPNDDYSFAPKVRQASQAGVFFVSDRNQPVWFREALQKQGKGELKIIDHFDPSSDQGTLSYVRAVNNISHGNGVIGVLVVTKLERMIENDFRSVHLPDGEIYLTDGSDRILASTTKDAGSKLPLPPDAKDMTTMEGILDTVHSDYIYVVNYSYLLQQKLVYRIPIHSLLQQQSELKRVIQFISVAYSVLAFVVMMYFWRSLMNPMQKLVHVIRSYVPGKPVRKTAARRRNDELGVLISSVYDMADRLNHLVNDKYQHEIKQKEAQLQILYQQINPHLLYNTLESIYWKSTLEGKGESAEMIKELSKLMKIGLSRGRELITIGEEMEHAAAYISLQQRRYEHTFRVEWKIMEDVRALLIPKITLQPLIENAIIHGVKNMGEDGEIVISAERQNDDKVIVRVEDNGFREADLNAIRRALHEEQPDPSLGYGIRNIHQRVRLHFGAAYGLDYTRNQPHGTVATITLPKREAVSAEQ
ncbi:cache domain-containing sensor histidine kinase [Paenibacillus oleatilyticus]|uniref:cache domain-containing sensor histidine kinase n=1 Tax=Paenibacillus oleatilyticus TaxID=2594886 RepID=UPI001C1F34E7|nr:sensor histidine kinase [Paenibacillus oleatilyticus]MBU7314890.1 sensor histidine kinase [Paenibacillus oleatilyticus]